MDPLTLFVISVIGAAAIPSRTPPSVRRFYDKESPGPQGWTAMQAHNVTWWVEPGEAVWIKAKYLRPIAGNLFYTDKLQAVSGALRSGDKLEFISPFGQIQRIDRSMIEESQQYADDDDGPPWSTGDEELDLYLRDPDTYLDDRSHDPEERAELQAEIEEGVGQAELDGDGDFGQWMATVRDGNHRAFGSVLGGEEFVAIRIYDNDVGDIQESVRSGYTGWLGDENRALLEKAIKDTGSAPWWLEKMQPQKVELVIDEPTKYAEAEVLHPWRDARMIARQTLGNVVDSKVLMIEQVFVKKRWRGAGIGEDLVRQIEQWGADNGAAWGYLEACDTDSDDEVWPFWAALGWIPVTPVSWSTTMVKDLRT